jgi:hypothetical protein
MWRNKESDLTQTERTYLRASRMYSLFLLLCASAMALLAPVGLRWLALAGASICLIALLCSYLHVTERTVGWTAVLIGSAVIGFAAFASPTTLSNLLAPLSEALNQQQLSVVATSYLQDGGGALLALGIPLILLNRSQTQISPRIQFAAAFFGLSLAFAYGLAIIALPSTTAIDPFTFLIVIALAVACDITRGKWKVAIATAAGILGVELVVNHENPSWRSWVLADVVRTWHFAIDNTHDSALGLMLLAGAVTALQGVHAGLSRRIIIVSVCLVAIGIWIGSVSLAASR